MSNITNYLLLIIGIIFIAQQLYPQVTDAFIFDPSVALTQPWRFVTSIFLHANLEHIFFNALALWMFGSILERRVSFKDYMVIFFGAGLLGSILYYGTYLVGIIPPIPALGASGAIYGVMGAVGMLLPDMTILVFFFPMKMRYAIVVWLLLTFFGAFDISSGVADAAHLGGLVFGLLFGYYLLNKPPEFHQPYEWEHEQASFPNNP